MELCKSQIMELFILIVRRSDSMATVARLVSATNFSVASGVKACKLSSVAGNLKQHGVESGDLHVRPKPNQVMHLIRLSKVREMMTVRP
jgi:methionine salvage enolase-phosphatase E1